LLTDAKLAALQAERRKQHSVRIKQNVESVLQEREAIMEDRGKLMAKIKELTSSLQELNEALDESGVDYYGDKKRERDKENQSKRKLHGLEVDLMAQILKTDFRKPKAEPKFTKPIVVLPDLMAEMIANAPKIEPMAAPVDHLEPEIEIPKEEVAPIRAREIKKEIVKLDIPLKRQVKTPIRDVTRVPIPEKEYSRPFVRPPAVYTNIPSPLGVWTEMAQEQLKKSG
jgi:hypothetical protein